MTRIDDLQKPLQEGIGLQTLRFAQLALRSASEDETGQRYGDQLAMYLIELPRVVAVSDNPVTQWLHYIRKMSTFASRPDNLPTKYGRLFDLSETDGMSLEQLMDYMKNMLTKEREQSIAKASYDLGFRQGIHDGEEKGMEKGRAEAQKSFAIQLLQMGMSVPDVARVTSLAVEEVTRLQN